MKKIVMILMSVALVALPTMAQSFGSQEQPNNAVFQSTSTMTPSGSAYASQPALNADGTAYSPVSAASAPSGPRKAPGLIITDEQLKEGDTPIGDAILPLTLMALAFCGVIYLRRRKALNR